MKTYNVAVLGATGAVGQKFVRLLEGHPWFRVAEVVAGEGHAGESYREGVDWIEASPLPEVAGSLPLRTVRDDLDADLCFSALPGGKAGPVERALAGQGYPVFTNARDLRKEADVPLVIAEVNPEHLALVDQQRRIGDGFVVANGNCTSILLALALKPVSDRFHLESCEVVSLQAVSGAGYPGVPSLDIVDNVVPFIPGEEAKVETELPKFFGRLDGGQVVPAPIAVSATCTRVPVLDGHTLAVAGHFGEPSTREEVLEAFRSFRGEPQRLRLPSAPETPLVVRSEEYRPQPRMDRDAGGGMSVTVGRLRPGFGGGWKFITTGSNTVRGAAGGAILNAELAARTGYL